MEVGDLDQNVRRLGAHQAVSLRMLPGGLPRSCKGGAMNGRHRKQMRLKSRHYRKGHTQFCKCWEFWQKDALAIKKRMESGEPLPRRRVRVRASEPASPRAGGNSPAWPPHP